MQFKKSVRMVNAFRVWSLYGDCGVVTWRKHPFTGFGPVGIHGATPRWKDMPPSADCPFLEGTCYFDTSYLGGDNIGKAWVDADLNDDVIWRELTEWYEAQLAWTRRAA